MCVIIAAASRECISRFDSEEPMKHGFKATSNRTTAIPTELDGSFCSNLVGISCRTLNDIFFWIRPADVQMLHATHHRRPMMSNYQMLIGGACQEVIHASGQVHLTFGQ